MDENIIHLNSDLEEVTMTELDFRETIDALFNGETILLTTYDNRRDKDVLIRFNEGPKGIVTQVTKPYTTMGGFTGANRYWSLYDIDLNTLSLYPTYIFDPTIYGLGNLYEPNSIVEYMTDSGEKDVALIRKVMINTEGEFYYLISGEEEAYKEKELRTI